MYAHLPGPRLEQTSLEKILQPRLRERLYPHRVGEEGEQQRDAHVGRRQILQQQLSVARRQIVRRRPAPAALVGAPLGTPWPPPSGIVCVGAAPLEAVDLLRL